MPYLENNSYRPPWPFRNTHFNTIYSSQLRRIGGVAYQRSTLFTPDDDFIDLDWIKQGSSRLLIAVHGLEGSADSTYLRGMVRHYQRKGWDILAMNFRSCSGRINQQLRSYHMGASDDLGLVVQHAVEEGYPMIGLVGFSLGGNVVLKYLGEDPASVPEAVRAGVGISVPCHIPSANVAIAHWQNSLYMLRFMRSLNPKLKTKARLFPDQLSLPNRMPRNFQEFDDHFTGPVHGFRDAKDYWSRCSSTNFMEQIQTPALLLQARDDTFLSPACFPVELAREHPKLHLEVTTFGGHCGFYTRDAEGIYLSEKKAYEFMEPYF